MADLAKVMLRVNEAEEKRQEAQRQYHSEMDTFDKLHRENFSIDLFQMYDKYMERLSAVTVEAEKRLHDLKPDVDKQMTVVLDKRKNRRIVEKLKERAQERHKEAMNRLERKELEEYRLIKRKDDLQEEEFGTPKEPRIVEQDTEEFVPRKQIDDALADYFKSIGQSDPRVRS